MPEKVKTFGGQEPTRQQDRADVVAAKQDATRQQDRLRESDQRGLGKALDAPVEVTLQGETYKVAALEMDDLAELEAWLKSQRLQAVIDATITMLPGERAMAIAKTAAEPVSYLDVLELRNSTVGCRRIAWLCLRRHQPTITLTQVEELTPDLETIMVIIDQLSDLFEEEETVEGEAKPEGGEERRPTDSSPLTFGSPESAESTE